MTITIGNFGQQHGRLGNQLFQLGLLFAVSERYGYDFYLPHRDESLWGCFDLDIDTVGPDCPSRFYETNGSCNFDPRVFEQPDGTCYQGYFQSYRYLEECRPELVRRLRFRDEQRARSEVTRFAYRRRYGRPLVSLHVRRGDYVDHDADFDWGNLASDGYYHRAIQAIGDDVTYLVFSDDLPWCRQNLEIDRLEFVDLDHFTSLCLMTGCDVNVVANSSFSWWGAFLNPSAEVYAPSRWWRAMPPPNDHQDDIVPPAWRTIPTFGAYRDLDARVSR
jgi:Glycosyl transferase family 11